MHNILIVDDESVFLDVVTRSILINIPEVNIFKALNGKEALEILRAYKIDLVITDLAMPVMDGYELIDRIYGFIPDMPVIAITAYHIPDKEKKLRAKGLTYYLQKPFELKELEQQIIEALNIGSKGFIKGVSLPNFMQLMEMESKTCTLKIKSKAQSGKIYFRKGELINAQTDKAEGLPAAYDILSWEDPEIRIEDLIDIIPKEIHSPVIAVILEASKQADEQAEATH